MRSCFIFYIVILLITMSTSCKRSLHEQEFIKETGTLVEITGKDTQKKQSIHSAAQHGNINRIKELLKEGKDINFRNKWNETPLHYAAYFGKTETVSFLIKNGANVNVKGDTGWTPLHSASKNGTAHTIILLGKMISILHTLIKIYNPLIMIGNLSH